MRTKTVPKGRWYVANVTLHRTDGLKLETEARRGWAESAGHFWADVETQLACTSIVGFIHATVRIKRTAIERVWTDELTINLEPEDRVEEFDPTAHDTPQSARDAKRRVHARREGGHVIIESDDKLVGGIVWIEGEECVVDAETMRKFLRGEVHDLPYQVREKLDASVRQRFYNEVVRPHYEELARSQIEQIIP